MSWRSKFKVVAISGGIVLLTLCGWILHLSYGG